MTDKKRIPVKILFLSLLENRELLGLISSEINQNSSTIILISLPISNIILNNRNELQKYYNVTMIPPFHFYQNQVMTLKIGVYNTTYQCYLDAMPYYFIICD